MPFAVNMPKLSPTMQNGAIAKWHVKEGQYVESGQLLLEVSTDKATIEYSALDSGWLRKILIQEGQTATVNQAIAIFTEEKNENIENFQPPSVKPTEQVIETIQQKTEVERPTQKPSIALSGGNFEPETPLTHYVFHKPAVKLEKGIQASPLAKKIAKEKQLDLTSIKGSGPRNRIVSRDLELAQPLKTLAVGHQEIPEIAPGTYEEEALTPIRKVIGQRLQEAKAFIPHFYVKQDVDAEALVCMRDQLLNADVKVSFNDLIVRATAISLRQHPEINSGFNSVNQTIIRFKTIDIAIAVSVELGLITPIIRHADFKQLEDIAIETRYLAKKAREGKLDPTEYKGGSFTISNLGMFGITDFQAIINPPQAAILAVSTIRDVPIVKNHGVCPGKMMTLTLSADHRVIDGATAAKFMQDLKKYLENPVNLLLHF